MFNDILEKVLGVLVENELISEELTADLGTIRDYQEVDTSGMVSQEDYASLSEQLARQKKLYSDTFFGKADPNTETSTETGEGAEVDNPDGADIGINDLFAGVEDKEKEW